MAISSLLPTMEQASQKNILRSIKKMLRERTLTWEGTSGKTLLTAFTDMKISFGDQIYLTEEIPCPTVNFELDSIGSEPLELGRQSRVNHYHLTITVWTKSTPSSTTEDSEARRNSVATLFDIGNFVDRLMTANHNHIDIVDENDSVVGSMEVFRWTGLSRVTGEMRLLGRCVLLVETQRVT